jgi:alcohol dehydrogenase YqhD (iron-dependent ADH family)
MNFEFATAQRIVFGPGKRAELPALIASFGSRLLLVTGKSGRGGKVCSRFCIFASTVSPRLT